jgi:ribose transport system ATP-binding protein
MEGASKRYGGVKALEKADLTVEAGKIHAILGENGAGKSTLIKIMSGVVEPDEGRMLLYGREVKFASPAAANQAGIVCIFQELSLVPDLSVADNISISNPPQRFGLIDRRAQRRIAEEALARPAPRTSIRWRPSRTWPCRAARWSKSPRPWRAIRASSSSTRRHPR